MEADGYFLKSINEGFNRRVDELNQHYQRKYEKSADLYESGICIGLDYAEQIFDELWKEDMED